MFAMKKTTLFALGAMLPSLVLAHPGHESTSILSGLMTGALHPLLGLDHLLALLLVGALAAQLEGRHRWGVVLTFVGLMGLGFFSAHAGLHVASVGTVEALIATSLVVGAVLLLAGQLAKRHVKESTLLNSLSAWCMTGFATFHGVAHGLEIPAGAAASGFGVGFLLMSLCLMATAILGLAAFDRQVRAQKI